MAVIVSFVPWLKTIETEMRICSRVSHSKSPQFVNKERKSRASGGPGVRMEVSIGPTPQDNMGTIWSTPGSIAR